MISAQPLLAIDLRAQPDVVFARQRARQIAALLGLDEHEQTRVATAVSEIARNAFEHGHGGRAEFSVGDDGRDRPLLLVKVRDRGPGIPHLDAVLGGTYKSTLGMGLGLVGARRLSDHFTIDAPAGQGTTVTIGTRLPRRVAPERLAHVVGELARVPVGDALGEATWQNRELLATLDALQLRQAEVERLNRELAETNRGVLALYAELDEKAEQLRRASEQKSRFLSRVSHELRTPLASVLNVTWLLLAKIDGPLEPEQERQVGLVRSSAQSLIDIVNDLLDLAKIEAGKVDVKPTTFSADELLDALRGTFRPLATNPDVALVVENASHVPPIFNDERKLQQILRNFLGNALKFTERGQVRLYVSQLDADRVTFAVRDTGIGIAPDDQARVFEEFSQVDGPVQRRVQGTGLGLPVSHHLAQLLGGSVALTSVLGEGSEFSVTVPLVYVAPASAPPTETVLPHPEAAHG